MENHISLLTRWLELVKCSFYLCLTSGSRNRALASKPIVNATTNQMGLAYIFLVVTVLFQAFYNQLWGGDYVHSIIPRLEKSSKLKR